MTIDNMITIHLADGTTFEVDAYEAENVVGVVNTPAERIAVGLVNDSGSKNTPRFYGFTNCCFESKIRDREDDDEYGLFNYLACGSCYEKVDEVFGNFFAASDVINRV